METTRMKATRSQTSQVRDDEKVPRATSERLKALGLEYITGIQCNSCRRTNGSCLQIAKKFGNTPPSLPFPSILGGVSPFSLLNSNSNLMSSQSNCVGMN